MHIVRFRPQRGTATGEEPVAGYGLVECDVLHQASDPFKGKWLISGALNGLPLLARLERAAAAGALATTSRGDMDGMPTVHALDAFLTEQKTAGNQGPERIQSDRTTEPAARQDRTAAESRPPKRRKR